MKPISGFERPWIQWLFVLLSFVLIGVAAWQIAAMRRHRQTVEQVRTDMMNARLERNEAEARLAREQSAREALALQLARERVAPPSGGMEIPTLTLNALLTRGPKPPEPTVPAQAPHQVVELRLMLPKGGAPHTRYEIVMRSWTGGDVVWSRGGIVARTIEGRRVVAANVTGDVLSQGSYEFLLSGITLDGQKEEVAAYEVGVK